MLAGRSLSISGSGQATFLDNCLMFEEKFLKLIILLVSQQSSEILKNLYLFLFVYYFVVVCLIVS